MSRRKQFDFELEESEVIPSPVRTEILRKTQDDGVTPLAGAKLIARERLRPDPVQPRRAFDAERLQALAASLIADGMQSPITAYYDDDDDIFTIVTGERRWRASGIAGMTHVPVLLTAQPNNPADVLGRQLAENLLRSDLTELEKALALARMRELQPQSWVDLANTHGLSDRRVYQMLSLLDAPEPIKEAIQAGRISGRHARAVTRLPAGARMAVLSDVIGRHLSVRDTEELVRSLLPDQPGDEAESAELDELHVDQSELGPTAGAVVAVLDAPSRQQRRRQVRRFATRVDAMESQLRNVRLGELLPSVPELPEYVQRMRRLRDALDSYIGFLERVHLDMPGEMEEPS